MAWQHFYSRVPARVSMYNRADGFDTFAHSEGLERDFIERELAVVYEKKLSKVDATQIRKGEMPNVYAQCCTRSGVLVQNCISFLPLDYTGERSAYLSHSLIFSLEEKERVLTTHEGNTLNPALFITSIDSFAITAPNATPDSSYPQKVYTPGRAQECASILSNCDSETAKAFLYAVLYALCGKGKNIFFKVPGEDAQQSIAATQLFNEVLSILPYSLRGKLSFVSRVSELSQYANFKLKGISNQFPENPGSKGVYFDLKMNQVVGLTQDEVTANNQLLNFFYSLLKNEALRAEFLSYVAQVAVSVPSAQNLNMKTLSELVFLFQCSCGLYPEPEILPNDAKVYEYLCAYEKYRVALSPEYRMQAYRCLMRYPQNHIAIPKNIFSKVSKLYAAEVRPAKRVCMNIVLELIHTDIMRDKLFIFIRNHYSSEDEDIKKIIIADLTRVFYGGFLQTQILNFFAEQFPNEPEESQTLIMEKLLLSIRTSAVQEAVLSFIDQHYENMAPGLRRSFYDTFLEMLPECDGLSVALTAIVNHHIETEDQATKNALAQSLAEALEADYRKKEHRLLPVLTAQPGFCEDVVIRLTFGPWQSRKIYSEYLQLLAEKTIAEKTAGLGRIVARLPATVKPLLAQASELYGGDMEKGSLYVWLEAAEQLRDVPSPFADVLREAVITPAICRRVGDVFDLRMRADGMALLESYADAVPSVRASAEYGIISAYHDLVKAAEQANFAAVTARMEELSQSGLGPRISDYLGRCGIDAKQPDAALCLEIVQGCLKDGNPQLDAVYRKRSGGTQEGAVQAMEQLVGICSGLCRASETAAAMLCGDLSALASAFSADYGKGAARWLRGHTADDPFGTALASALAAQKDSGSLLSRLFRRRG